MLAALNNAWRRSSLAAFSGILMATSATVQSAEPLSPVETLINLPRPLVIGHRGYNQIAPENTLPSFKLAKAAGADLVELDYHHTKDGVPVVIHDSELDRTTDAVARWGGKKIPVASKTLNELRSLDAGQWFDPKYAGTRLSSLSEALDFIQDGSVTLIERKGGDAATCVKLLREHNLVNRLVVQSFDWSYLKDFHQQEPRQVLGALGPPGWRGGKKLTDAEKELNPSWVDEVKHTGARAVVWNNQITREAVAYAHQQGIKVWVYTVNEPAVANKLLDLGADGLITDNPSIMWRAMALRNSPAIDPR